MNSNIRFISKDRNRFFGDLRKKVDHYFKENKLQKTGGGHLFVKLAVMFALYLIPYSLVLFVSLPAVVILMLYIVMGIGIGGIGLAIMHDANHGAFSSKPAINTLVGYSLNFVGGDSFIWKIKHNVLHHTYTNIYGHDDDLNAAKKLIRLSPSAEWHPAHKYQYLYGPFFYSLLTLMWVVLADYLRFYKFHKMGLIKKNGGKTFRQLAILIFSKIFYFSYLIVLPLLITNIPWYFILLGFLLMHFTAGLVLSFIFQLAHIVEEADYPLPDEEGIVENQWAIHQLQTTANFANKNKLLTWYAGGLNFQVEHHLFPNISHVHYPAISKIVKETTSEYNLPYHQFPDFFSALKSHMKMMKKLGTYKTDSKVKAA